MPVTQEASDVKLWVCFQCIGMQSLVVTATLERNAASLWSATLHWLLQCVIQLSSALGMIEAASCPPSPFPTQGTNAVLCFSICAVLWKHLSWPRLENHTSKAKIYLSELCLAVKPLLLQMQWRTDDNNPQLPFHTVQVSTTYEMCQSTRQNMTWQAS